MQTSAQRHISSFRDTEQFIEDRYPVRLNYHCSVSCSISGNGWKEKPLRDFLRVLGKYIPHNFRVKCAMAYTDCPEPYTILWKVKNNGPEAERRDMIRGQIEERGKSIIEPASFYGNHYIECYIVKNGFCVARKKIEIPIGRR